MKVTCPGCEWSTEVPEEKIPDAGAEATCPKCKIKFHVKKKTELILDELPISQTTTTQRETKPCPLCGEVILSVAKKCKHCNSMLDGSSPAAEKEPKPKPQVTSPKKQAPTKTDLSSCLNRKDKVVTGVLGFVILLLLFTEARPVTIPLVLILTSYYLIKKGMVKWKAIGCGLLVSLLFLIVIPQFMKSSPKASSASPQPKEQKQSDAFNDKIGSLYYDKCKESIKTQLKAPTTAIFPSYPEASTHTAAYESDGTLMYIFHVDSQNSYGAMMRTKCECIVKTREGSIISTLGEN